MKVFPKIETPRCVLNCITEKDVAVLEEIFRDIHTRKFLPEIYELIDTPNDVQRFFSVFEHYFTINEGFLWGIYKNKTLLGFVAIMDLSSSPALFYAMHPDYRQRGFMKEAIEAVIGFVCSNNLCCSLQSEVYKENLISINLLQSVGFDVMEADGQKFYLRKDLTIC